MESFIMNATTILTGISTILLILILYVYGKNLIKIKSKFTIVLFAFALLFLIQNLVSLYFFLTMKDYYVPQVEVHVFILTLLQAIAFSILLKITWE